VDKGFFRFRREEHLKGRDEIRLVFGKGKRYSVRGAVLFVLKNELPHNRICFTFSRGFGNAVARNRARRLSREAYRLMKNKLYTGYDLILQVQSESLADTKLSDREGQLESLFSKAGLMK
jgi:ribonuclease P protein component